MTDRTPTIVRGGWGLPASTPLELRDVALFELAYGGGLLTDELVAADTGDLDSGSLHLSVTTARAGSRVIALDPPILESVRAWLARGRPALVARPEHGPPESALFLSRNGRRLSQSDVRRRLQAARRRVALAEPGMQAVSYGTGAATIGTTRPYTRVESRRLRKAYASAHPRA